MSTSVYYKGAKLIDVDNNTKTLLTAGKYLEDDVTLTDVTVYQTHTVTLTNSGSNYMAYIEHNGVSYYSSDDVIDVSDGDTIKIWLNYGNNNILYVNEEKIAEATAGMAIDYTYTVTSDVEIRFSLTFGTSSVRLTEISDIQTLSVTENGTYTASGTTRGYSPVTVNVPNPSTSSLTVTPTESQQTFNATGVYGYKPVTINGISSTYVGTGIARKSSTDTTFTSTNGTFTAPIGYYSAAATKTLTTQAAQTIYPSTATQYVSSYRWLTGSQTIASVTTSNLTAENIAEGVVVKVGDTNNASRIAQITGTHDGKIEHTCTIYGSGLSTKDYVLHNNTKYYTNGSTFSFKEGDIISLYAQGSYGAHIGDGTHTKQYTETSSALTYSFPALGTDITIELDNNAGEGYAWVTYDAFPINWEYGGLAIIPTTINQQISVGSSYYALGDITIAGDSHLVASNIADGVSIFGVSGTHTGSATPSEQYYKATLMNYGATNFRNYIRYNNKNYYQSGSTFYFKAGDTISYYGESITGSYVYSDGTRIYSSTAMVWGYDYIAPAHPLNIMFSSGVCFNSPTISISSNGIYDVTDYASASVNAGGGEYYNIYKCLVNDGIIYSSGSAFGTNSYTSQEVSNWCDSYGSIISDYTFAGKILSGSFTFSNVSTISRYAFAFPLPDIGQVSTTPQTTLYFPEASEFKDGCFLNATRLKSIFASKCERILQYAFGGCTALSSVSFPNCSYISASAFIKCKNLISANFSSCENIGSQAFTACLVLSDISFPACTSIGSYAFASCSALTTASFPSCISMGSYAFAPCSALTTVSFPVCTSIGSYAFSSCIALTSIFFPVCNYIGENAFKNCSALTTASFSKCEYIGGQAFSGCRTLTEAIFPACTKVSTYVFAYCSSLKTASFPICSSFGAYTFCSCYNLISFYINQVSSIPTFGNFMFNSTPISNYSTVAGRYGSIFVPSSLYAAFTTASGWSTYSARMVSV